MTDPELTELATEIATGLGVVGAQIAVLARGELVTGSHGVTSVRTGLPVTGDTAFQIGSTTKVLTAAQVMQLVERGKIGLDTPVVDQLPGFRLGDPEATATVTPRHLMSMSSGIDNGPYSDHGRGDDAVTHYVAALAELPVIFQPGRGYGYSNASTAVSGRLVEHVTGLSWEAAVTRDVLEPCGMRDTASFAEDVIVKRVALGHTVNADGLAEQTDAWSLPRALAPAGMLTGSAADLVRFANLFLHEGVALNGNRVLSEASIKAMSLREVEVPPTLLAQWWGLGPYGKVWDGVEVMGHSGTNISGSSYLLWAADRDFAVATTVNVPNLGYPFASRVFERTFARYAGITVPPKMAPPTGPIAIDPSRLIGTYGHSGQEFIVTESGGDLWIEQRGGLPGTVPGPASVLRALTPTTFLPTDPTIDGGRGWALAFIDTEHGPATRMLNGFFALRRLH